MESTKQQQPLQDIGNKQVPTQSHSLPTVTTTTTSGPDYSSILSKTVLISPTEDQYELLRIRLNERIISGGGESIFEIGVGESNSIRIFN